MFGNFVYGNVALGIVSGGGRIYIYVASGGLQSGGAALVSKTKVSLASGGLQSGGAAQTGFIRIVGICLASGGLQSGGSAAVAIVKAFLASGGLQSGGAAAIAKEKAFLATGGLQSGGTALIAKVKAFLASGGLQSGGAADTIFVWGGVVYTPNFGFAEVWAGDRRWTVVLTEKFLRVIDALLNYRLQGRLSKSVAGGQDVALSATEYANCILEFTGALTGDINVIVPASPCRQWTVYNDTTGAHTLTVKPASGTGVAVSQGKRSVLYADGSNIVRVTADV